MPTPWAGSRAKTWQARLSLITISRPGTERPLEQTGAALTPRHDHPGCQRAVGGLSREARRAHAGWTGNGDQTTAPTHGLGHAAAQDVELLLAREESGRRVNHRVGYDNRPMSPEQPAQSPAQSDAALTTAYEQARYGEQEPSQERLTTLQESTDRLLKHLSEQPQQTQPSVP